MSILKDERCDCWRDCGSPISSECLICYPKEKEENE